MDTIPGIVAGPPELETQTDLNRFWRYLRRRVMRKGFIVEMPVITSKYHRTVLLKSWLEAG